jgi:uncharacterized protein Yka (UPF0111/DUF47 family)
MMSFMRRVLPHEPDVIGLLVAQLEMTVAGMAALVEWAAGEPDQDQAVRDIEHETDERKRTLWLALRDAFVTPLAPEDLFFMSARIDVVLGEAKDLVRESEAIDTPPDEAMHEMAQALAESVGYLLDACLAFRGGRTSFATATAAADAAHKAARAVEPRYRSAMAALLALDDRRRVARYRESYHRMSRMGIDLIEVAERVWYVAVKES